MACRALTCRRHWFVTLSFLLVGMAVYSGRASSSSNRLTNSTGPSDSTHTACATVPLIYVGMTTVNSSAPFSRLAISSMLDQTLPPAAVLVSVSAEASKGLLGARQWQKSSRIKVLISTEDQGPAMKFIRALQFLRSDPSALLVVIDDDKIYPPTLLEDLFRGYQNGGQSAVGCRGWIAPRDCTYPHAFWENSNSVYGHKLNQPVQVDVLTGSDSYMLQPAVFQDDSVWQTSNETLRMAMRMDDLWISGQLARRGVSRKVVPCRNQCSDINLGDGASLITHGRIERHNDLNGLRRHDVNTVLLQHFCEHWMSRLQGE